MVNVTSQALPYVEKLTKRSLDTIDLIVVHCTELPDLATARAYGERIQYASGTGNSGHFYVDLDGTSYRYVPIDRVAHHTKGFNHRSIGIELVNRGRYPDWLNSEHQQLTEPYPSAQIEALIQLLEQLRQQLPTLRAIAGHEDLDRTQVAASNNPSIQVRRKVDPGPLFPWHSVLAQSQLQRS